MPEDRELKFTRVVNRDGFFVIIATSTSTPIRSYEREDHAEAYAHLLNVEAGRFAAEMLEMWRRDR